MTKNDKPHIHATGRKTSASEELRNPLLSTDWKGPFEETARSHLDYSWSATPSQRLAWLEEARELAYQAGALSSKTHKDNFVPKNMEKTSPIKLRPS